MVEDGMCATSTAEIAVKGLRRLVLRQGIFQWIKRLVSWYKDVRDAAGARKPATGVAETESAVQREGGGWEANFEFEASAGTSRCDWSSEGLFRHIETKFCNVMIW